MTVEHENPMGSLKIEEVVDNLIPASLMRKAVALGIYTTYRIPEEEFETHFATRDLAHILEEVQADIKGVVADLVNGSAYELEYEEMAVLNIRPWQEGVIHQSLLDDIQPSKTVI